jgi:DNA repair protein RadC
MESLGGSENTVLDVRRVVKKALDRKAAALILIHNHPSGNPRPGKHDISRTNDLRNALRAFNIDLLDHLIISDGSFFSFGSDALVQMQQA